MSSDQHENPYTPTLESSGVSTHELETKSNRVIRHAKRAGLALIGMFFLGLLGPLVYALFFAVQRWKCQQVIKQYNDANLSIPGELLNARRRLYTATVVCGGLAGVVSLVLAGSAFRR